MGVSDKTCATCRFLVDDESPAYRDEYVRCSWWDGRSLPVIGRVIHTGAANWVTRKTALLEKGARLPQCDVHEA